MQALCQWEVQADESSESLQKFLHADSERVEAAGYAFDLVTAFWPQREVVDPMIESALTKWTLARLSPVERNIMRVAVVEMRGGKIPPKVAISEAIDIGREFGGEDTPRFVNGVLDAVLHALPTQAEE